MLFLILLGFFCCAVTSLSLGLATLRALRCDLDKIESLALGYVVGSAITSTLTLILGLLGAISELTFVTVTVLSLLLLFEQRKWFRGLAVTSTGSVTWPVKAMLLATLLSYGVLYFRQALAPEMSPDGTVYHLGFVNLWTHAGRIYRLVDMYAAMPQGIEMLFLFAFTIGRHSAAALIHLWFLFDLPLLMLLYGRRFGWSYFATAFAAILVFASPIFGTVGTVAYVDVALAAVVFASLFLLQIWRQNRNLGTLVVCCLLAGFALAIKYTAAPLPLFVAFMVAWETRKSGWAKMAGAVTVPALAVLLIAGPYPVRNWIWFGNPLAFFGNALFPNPWFHVSMERSYSAAQAYYHGIQWSDLPISLTVGNSKTPNSFGTLFLLAPLCLVGLVWRQSRVFVLAALAVGSIYAGNKDPRFLIPAVPLAAMALGFVLSQMPWAKAILCAIAVLHLVVSWPAFMAYTHFPPVWQWRIAPVPWSEALRLRPEAEYLASQPDYIMAKRIDELVPAGEPVLTFTGGAAQSYTTHPIVVCWRSAYGERMADFFFSKWHSAQDRRMRLSFTMPSQPLQTIRIIQNAAAQGMAWNVDEVELRSEGKLLPRSPKWRLNASPNPWDVEAAFDGNLATRWRSWDSLWPGMFISVDFLEGEKLDSVDVILDNREWTTLEGGPWPAQVSLEVISEDGRKTLLLPRISWDSPVDLRKDATAALKANGIHYVLINGNDWMQNAFRDHPEDWNMQAIAATELATLYRID
ncbi:MAG: hypothetical protein WBW33_01275 [Bryobacteraceae bacterium]